MQKFTFILLLAFSSLMCLAQSPIPIGLPAKVSSIYQKLQDTIAIQLKKAGFQGTPQALYLRSFKYERDLEVWLKPSVKEPYKLFKTYKVCQQSGTIGPKRVEGDYQVPEGCYYINEFNPNSNYHLSLGLNYPNASDRILSDQQRPGGAIYVHGNCVSTGCLPITDKFMEELYVLATMVRAQGFQEFIPIHIFPVRYNIRRSLEYLADFLKLNPSLGVFTKNLQQVFEYFEAKKVLPVIMVNKNGEYVID